MTRPANLLFLLSDEHAPHVLSCLGHKAVRTPALDGLAARGTRFAAAVTPSPICVPARAALATGRHAFEAGFFDNADPYDGTVESWHHRLRGLGHEVVSIGKLHYRGAAGEDHGFSRSLRPMHVVDAKGDLLSLIRDEHMPIRKGSAKLAATAGPGESDYTRYDRDIASDAQIWLREEAPKQDRPWALFVSLVTPHFPLIAPPEHFYAALAARPPLPKLYDPTLRPRHPALEVYATSNPYDAPVQDEETLRRMLAGYHGLVRFLDEQIGKILGALEAAGLEAGTRVLYASDHGDNCGARGLWGKSTMFEESVGVPMILAGPDIPEGRVVTTPTSLVDVFPTAVEALGHACEPPSPHGRSLFRLVEREEPDRAVLSEYHAAGSSEAAFLLRTRRWKYVRYVTYPPMLFDLEADPEELHDLGASAAHADIRAALEVRLRGIFDPDAVDARAKARQAQLLALHGGREAVLARGEIPYSPPPGVQVAFTR